MLLELQTTLQRILYERGQISEREVDIQFEAPAHERIERLLRPTINVFLFEVLENTELRSNGYQKMIQNNGKAEFRPPPRRFDLNYMISVLSSEVEDEHLLLWRVLTTLLRYAELPAELLPEQVRALEIPLVTRLCRDEEGKRLQSLWGSLGVQPRPALAYTVTVPVALDIVREAPLVLASKTRYSHGTQPLEAMLQIGGVVRNKRGEALEGASVAFEGTATTSVTNSAGQFTLRHVPPGQITLRITPLHGVPRLVTLVDPVSNPEGAAARFNEIKL